MDPGRRPPTQEEVVAYFRDASRKFVYFLAFCGALRVTPYVLSIVGIKGLTPEGGNCGRVP
eukprot:1291227-Amorphochlora_amoeboformis.AAC.1